MPVSEDKLYRSDGINRWFALSSVLMTLTIFWMIWVDYDRPYIPFQDNYFLDKAAFAHFDFLDASRRERQNEIQLAKQRLKDKQEEFALTKASQRAKLNDELAHAELQFKIANAPYSQASQVLEVTKDSYERALGAYGPTHPNTQSAREKFHEEEAAVDKMRQDKEHWEDEKKRIQGDINSLTSELKAKEKLVKDLEAVAETAARKDREYRGVLTDDGLLGGIPIIKAIINAPLLDFTAKKGTPARHQVNQLVLPQVRQRLNYLESYTTDRCTTCHVAINDPDFSKENLAKKLERWLPGINEELQREGRQPMEPPVALTVAGSDKPLPQGRVTEYWSELSRSQRDSYFDELQKRVNKYLKDTGRKTLELKEPLLAHPNLDLYLTPDSPHPINLMGCTVCHEGNPQETDFVQAAHSPPTHEIEKEWEEKYYIRLMGLPNITFETVEHFWDRPMRLPQHTEAGCAKCHAPITDIAKFEGERPGARINEGQHLFREVGCINCHEVKSLAGSRRVGPDLSRVSAKLKPGFVQQWAYYPQSFRPSTRMPHFFMQENNRAESKNKFDPDPVARTKTEVTAISKYLFAVSSVLTSDWKPLTPPEGTAGDVERGRTLFKSVGCLACHSNVAEFGEKWITKDLAQHEGLKEETAGYRYKGMTLNQRVRYAMEHFADQIDTFLSPDKTAFDPNKSYNPPVFTRFAPELSGIGSKVSYEWLYSWLMEPTHYSPDTKMPSLRLRPGEAADLATYLMTLKHDEFKDTEFTIDSAMQSLADELIFGLLSSQRSEQRSRAILRDEKNELSESLVGLIKNSLAQNEVRVAKDHGETLGDEQAKKKGEETAKKMIGSLSLDDKKMVFLGSKMIGHYGCYACHKIPGFEETTPPGTDLSAWAEKPVSQLDFAFYDDAFHGMREEKFDIFGSLYPRDAKQLNDLSPTPDDMKEQINHTHTAFAKHKLLNPRIWDREKIKKPYDKLKMPNFYFTPDEADALVTFLLSRIPPRVTDQLKVNYATDPLGPIAKGRALTRELNCVSCHQLEDNAPLVQQYFRRSAGDKEVFDVTNAPPLLWGEGAKAQHGWLHDFFLHVIPLRPWLQIRMPSFNITGDQATTLVEYFAALSQYDSRALKKNLGPIEEYRAKAEVAALASSEAKKPTEASAAPVQPGSDWYEKDPLHRFASNVENFGLDRKLVRPDDLNPIANPADRLRDAHARLLKRTEFLQNLYAVSYPFVEPSAPLESQDRFQKGEQFFTAMGCLKCHVMGDMLPGPAKNTDEFVQVYRLDSVRGDGDQATAILNGQAYAIGTVIDGHKLIKAENVVYESGDVETKATFEGPNAAGETEKIVLQAPSAPNLGLASQRLRRAWLHDWMLDPQAIQPGTKMPQNFRDGEAAIKGDERFPKEGDEQIQLLLDFLYDAGQRRTREPLTKTIATEQKPQEEFKE